MQELPGKNVLFLHKGFVLGGGIERVHQNLAQALIEKGESPSFYVHSSDGASQSGYSSLCAKLTANTPVQNSSVITKILFLLKHIKTHKIDVIIAATETANMLAFICSLVNSRISVIYTRHCAFDVSDQKLSPRTIKMLYSLYVLRGQVVAVSNSLKQTIQSALIWKTHRVDFIPNAVVSDDIFALSDKNSDMRDDGDYFCAVGRLTEQKGFDVLIDAYSKAKQIDSSILRLLIVGEGEDLAELSSQVVSLGLQDWIEFTGFTTNPYYIINHAKAFILSSRYEGMPTVLVEAMALNTPVIAFDCPTGPSELIEHNKNGLLVPNQDVDALVQAILNYKVLQGKNITATVDKFRYGSVAEAYISHF